jgi:hypothetical protein
MSAAPSADNVVFVVNIDAEASEFYDFAQRHALDLIGVAPPVWMWTIGGAPPEGTAVNALGRWPRPFDRPETVATALAEAVQEYLKGDVRVGVLVLVRSPASLLHSPDQSDEGSQEPLDLPLFAPLAKAIAGSRRRRDSFWSVCAVLEGPQSALKTASSVIARPIGRAATEGTGKTSTGLDTIAFLNPDYEGFGVVTDVKVRAGLRLLIDILRSGDLWDALRPSSEGGRPRILWLRTEPEGQLSRPSRLRHAITAVIDEKVRAAADPKASVEDEAKRRNTLRQFLAKHEPKTEHAGVTEPFRFDWTAVFSNDVAYRDLALASIAEDERRVRASLEEHYRNQTQSVARHQKSQDADYATAQTEIERLPLTPADAGLSLHGDSVVQQEIEQIEKRRAGWRIAAGSARRAVLSLHQAAQDRSDPIDPGEIELDALDKWKDFERAKAATGEAHSGSRPPS